MFSRRKLFSAVAGLAALVPGVARSVQSKTSELGQFNDDWDRVVESILRTDLKAPPPPEVAPYQPGCCKHSRLGIASLAS